MNLEKIAKYIAAVGALNWGLAQLNFDLVAKLGSFATVGYWVVGISGGYLLYEYIFNKKN